MMKISVIHARPHVARALVESAAGVPISLFASVMGLAGLSLALRLAAERFGLPTVLGELVGGSAAIDFILLAALYVVKWSRYPSRVREEFEHPVTVGFFGTIAIGLLLLSNVLIPYSAAGSLIVWLIGAAASWLIGGIVLYRLLQGEVDAIHAAPVWLIPGVAALDIVVTRSAAPYPWAEELLLLSLGIGSVIAVLFLTLIFARLIHRSALPVAMSPSLMILAAPFEVGFLAYTAYRGNVDAFGSLLFYFGLFLFALIGIRLLRSSPPFAPGWWAIGFPMAALTLAALKYSAARELLALNLLAMGLLTLLTATILVLTVRTLYLLAAGRLFQR